MEVLRRYEYRHSGICSARFWRYNDSMSGVLTIGFVRTPLVDEQARDSLHDRILGLISPIPGFLSSTLWQAQADSESYMLMNEYANEGSADAGFRAVMEGPLLEAIASSFATPMDLRRLVRTFADGAAAAHVPVGKYLSISDRTADPGHGVDLESELRRIFGELQLIDGYLGSQIGRNIALDEDVMGLVFWDSVEAFMASLPLKVVYEVRLWHRLR